MMRFSREHLETLSAVVDAGTFDAAAARLRVTPSAVSQRIKAFEQQLGRVLVVRSTPVRATESGEVLLRLARQQALLDADAATALGADDAVHATIPLAVNADSMATWLLPALAEVTRDRPLLVELHRDDQEHTASLLASGTVMAAVTSQAEPVPGCTVTPLGHMRYRAVATPAFVTRWFADGITADALRAAPMVEFDRKDELQRRFVHSIAGDGVVPPRHAVPASADFASAVILGLGWGMLPDAQADAARRDGALVDLPGSPVHVPLHWQQWNLRSASLDAVADAVVRAARAALR